MISGEMEGAAIPLKDGESIILGRDPTQVELIFHCQRAVSYTHLDVYKRQAMLYAVNIAMKAVIYTDYGMSPSGIPMIIDMMSMSVCLFTYALAMAVSYTHLDVYQRQR